MSTITKKAKFRKVRSAQTLFENTNVKEIEPVKHGPSKGSFVVIEAVKVVDNLGR